MNQFFLLLIISLSLTFSNVAMDYRPVIGYIYTNNHIPTTLNYPPQTPHYSLPPYQGIGYPITYHRKIPANLGYPQAQCSYASIPHQQHIEHPSTSSHTMHTDPGCLPHISHHCSKRYQQPTMQNKTVPTPQKTDNQETSPDHAITRVAPPTQTTDVSHSLLPLKLQHKKEQKQKMINNHNSENTLKPQQPDRKRKHRPYQYWCRHCNNQKFDRPNLRKSHESMCLERFINE